MKMDLEFDILDSSTRVRPVMGVLFQKRNVTRSNAEEAAKQGGRSGFRE
jgi:hypothetical protein